MCPTHLARRQSATSTVNNPSPRVGWYYGTFPTRGHFTVPLPFNDHASPEFNPFAPQLQKRAFSVVLEGWSLHSDWVDGAPLSSEVYTVHSPSHVAVTHGAETLDFVFSAAETDIRVDFFPLKRPLSVSHEGRVTLRFGLLRGKVRATMTLSVTLSRKGAVVCGPHVCRTRLVAQQTTVKRTGFRGTDNDTTDAEAESGPIPVARPRARRTPGARVRSPSGPLVARCAAPRPTSDAFDATIPPDPHSIYAQRVLSRQHSGSYIRRRLDETNAGTSADSHPVFRRLQSLPSVCDVGTAGWPPFDPSLLTMDVDYPLVVVSSSLVEAVTDAAPIPNFVW